jgi:hypothetical protein
MQLSKTQITALLTEVASQEDGLNEILRMSFEAMMKAERQEHLLQSTEDANNAQTDPPITEDIDPPVTV